MKLAKTIGRHIAFYASRMQTLYSRTADCNRHKLLTACVTCFKMATVNIKITDCNRLKLFGKLCLVLRELLLRTPNNQLLIITVRRCRGTARK